MIQLIAYAQRNSVDTHPKSNLADTLTRFTDWILVGALFITGVGGGALAIWRPERDSAAGGALVSLLAFSISIGVSVLFFRTLVGLLFGKRDDSGHP